MLIEFVHGLFNFLFRDGGQLPAFREVLPNEAVGALVRSACLQQADLCWITAVELGDLRLILSGFFSGYKFGIVLYLRGAACLPQAGRAADSWVSCV